MKEPFIIYFYLAANKKASQNERPFFHYGNMQSVNTYLTCE